MSSELKLRTLFSGEEIGVVLGPKHLKLLPDVEDLDTEFGEFQEFRALNVDEINCAILPPFSFTTSDPVQLEIRDVVSRQDQDGLKKVLIDVVSSNIRRYQDLKSNCDENPELVFNEDRLRNACYWYLSLFGHDRWFVENVMLPVLTSVDQSPPARIIDGSAIQHLLQQIVDISEEDFEFILPHIIDCRFEWYRTRGSFDKDRYSLDVLSVLCYSNHPSRLLKYFRSGGKVANFYWRRGCKYSSLKLSNESDLNFAVREILINLGLCDSYRPNHRLHGYSSYNKARHAFRLRMENYGFNKADASTSDIYSEISIKWMDDEKNLAYSLLAILAGQSRSFTNIDIDPSDAPWHGVFVSYRTPYSFATNPFLISATNAVYVSAIVYRLLDLIASIGDADPMEIKSTIKHVVFDIVPILERFESSFEMFQVRFGDLLMDWGQHEMFNKYLECNDPAQIETMQADVFGIMSKSKHPLRLLKVSDWRFGYLPNSQLDASAKMTGQVV